MTIDDNRARPRAPCARLRRARGFTYTVLDPASRAVMGCVYIYPDEHGDRDAAVTSWVRTSHAELDLALRKLVSEWLIEAWPFEGIDYATRRRDA